MYALEGLGFGDWGLGVRVSAVSGSPETQRLEPAAQVPWE